MAIIEKSIRIKAPVENIFSYWNDPENLPVLIHCYHGQGRAVLFSALYRIEFEGWDPDRARRATRLVLEGSSFDDNAGKGRYLIDYERIRQTEGANGIFAQRR